MGGGTWPRGWKRPRSGVGKGCPCSRLLRSRRGRAPTGEVGSNSHLRQTAPPGETFGRESGWRPSTRTPRTTEPVSALPEKGAPAPHPSTSSSAIHSVFDRPDQLATEPSNSGLLTSSHRCPPRRRSTRSREQAADLQGNLAALRGRVEGARPLRAGSRASRGSSRTPPHGAVFSRRRERSRSGISTGGWRWISLR